MGQIAPIFFAALIDLVTTAYHEIRTVADELDVAVHNHLTASLKVAGPLNELDNCGISAIETLFPVYNGIFTGSEGRNHIGAGIFHHAGGFLVHHGAVLDAINAEFH